MAPGHRDLGRHGDRLDTADRDEMSTAIVPVEAIVAQV
jgi:hypothetical protein